MDYTMGGARDTGSGSGRYDSHTPRFRFAHDILRGRRMGRTYLCRRSGVRTATKDGGYAKAVQNAGIPLVPAPVHSRSNRRPLGNRLGTNQGRKLFADLRFGHPRSRIPGSSNRETIEKEPMRNAIVTEKAPKPLGPYSQAIIE